MSFPSPDTQAALLLCARLGQRDDSLKPLTVRQYGAVARQLSEHSLRPGDLLRNGGREKLSQLELSDVPQGTIEKLLDRGAALGLMVERWISRGLWIVGRDDPAYPTRYAGYLRQVAPPVLYGVGERSLLQNGGLAVVGSRDASEEDLSFAERLGTACAAQKLSVVSGAAKGIDSAAMMAAVNQGGCAVGVLAEGLGRAALAGQYHDAILEDRLTLISAYEPESWWLTFAAMERNKLIYALADAAVVVATSAEQGGTWAGAVEALKRAQIPVFAKAAGELAPGNRKLHHAGAREFPEEAWGDLTLLSQSAAVVQPLFEQKCAQPETPELREGVSVQARSESASGSVDSARTAGSGPTAETAQKNSDRDAYDRIIPLILELAAEPLDEKSFAEKLSIPQAQAKAWLKRASDEGLIRKKNRPVPYVRSEASPRLFPEEPAMGARPRQQKSR